MQDPDDDSPTPAPVPEPTLPAFTPSQSATGFPVAAAGWTLRDLQLRKWVLDNPGACKDTADRCKVSAEYVRLVLYGKRGGGAGAKKNKGRVKAILGTSPKMMEIIRMLKSKGAPI